MMVRAFLPLLLLGFAQSCAGVGQGGGHSFLHPVQRGVPLSECSIFYQTVVSDSDAHSHLDEKVAPRKANVEAMLKEHKQIRRFGGLHWNRDWKIVGPLFEALGMRTSNSLREGFFANWANMLMALAWQDAFEKPCMITLEDDVVLPANFETHLASHSIDPQGQKMFRFWDYSQGYVFSLGAARALRDKIYASGVADDEGYGHAADSYINAFMHPERVDVGVSLIDNKHNGGSNVWDSPEIAAGFEQEFQTAAGSQKDGKQLWQQFGSLARQADAELIDLPSLAKTFVAGASLVKQHDMLSASSPHAEHESIAA